MQIELNDTVAKLVIDRAKKLNMQPNDFLDDITFAYFSSDDYIAALAPPLFVKIPSVRKVYLSSSDTITTIISDDDPADRCKVYDAEQALAAAVPSRNFSFFTATNEANYSAYKKLYEKKVKEDDNSK